MENIQVTLDPNKGSIKLSLRKVNDEEKEEDNETFGINLPFKMNSVYGFSNRFLCDRKRAHDCSEKFASWSTFEPFITTFTKSQRGTVDYIYYVPQLNSDLRVKRVL